MRIRLIQDEGCGWAGLKQALCELGHEITTRAPEVFLLVALEPSKKTMQRIGVFSGPNLAILDYGAECGTERTESYLYAGASIVFQGPVTIDCLKKQLNWIQSK